MEVNLVRNPSSSTSTRRRNREQSGQSGSDDGEFAAAGSSRDTGREVVHAVHEFSRLTHAKFQDVQLQPMHPAITQGLPPSDVLTGSWVGPSSNYQSPAQGGWSVGGQSRSSPRSFSRRFLRLLHRGISRLISETTRLWGSFI